MEMVYYGEKVHMYLYLCSINSAATLHSKHLLHNNNNRAVLMLPLPFFDYTMALLSLSSQHDICRTPDSTVRVDHKEADSTIV